jgi:hypothetical protein
VKTHDQRVFVFNVQELSEALAAYVFYKTSEKVLDIETVSINVDAANGLLIWTVTHIDAKNAKSKGDA